MWKDKKTYAALLAEFLGTLLLVFIGCGSGTNWGDGSGSIIQISLAVGFTLASIVQVSAKFQLFYLHKWSDTITLNN